MVHDNLTSPATEGTGTAELDILRARIAALEAEKGAILEAALDCIVTIDHESRVVEWNSAAERTFGYARADVLGRDLAELVIPPELRQAHHRGLTHYLATGEGPVLGRRIEVKALHADGSTFPVELAITPTPSADRTLFTAYLRNITERLHYESTLCESEARFRMLAENIPLLCWTADPTGYIVWYNQRWYDYTGTTPEEMTGWGWQAVHDPETLPEVIERWRSSVASGESFDMVFPLRGADGVFRPFLTRCEPQKDNEGRVLRWIGTNTEVNDIVEAREALARSRVELERLVEERTAALLREVEERRRAEEALRQGEKLQAIGQLTGGIAHDFNNILQVVASGAALLRMSRLTEERRRIVLDGLTKATENAKDLTSRLLAFARKQALQPEPIDLNVRLAGMSELLRHTLGSRINVETDFAPDLWSVMVDPSQLEVSILNLAVNARDAMLPEGGTLTLQTRNAVLEATSERAAGDYVCMAVKDTGKGMAPAVMARVFEPFFTTKGPDKGTGLGLAQVHGFAKQSGGDIAIKSAPGESTAVYFHLPRTTGAVRLDAPQVPAREAEGATLQRTAGKVVLVVDDNPDVASFAASMLEGLGYATRLASNAAEALTLIGSGERVDAMFSDVVMPGPMNGVQLASALRLSFPHLAVVLATGYSEVLAEWNGMAGPSPRCWGSLTASMI